MKRIISLLLTIVLCCSLLPTFALGAPIPVQTDPIRKVDMRLLQEIADKPDEEPVTVTLWLKGPTREEIEALVPMEKPDSDAPREERDAYQNEYAQMQAGVCSGIYDRFMDKYRDPEKDQIVTSAYDDQPHLQVIVRKDRIPFFAAVDEVLWINRGESVYLQYDTPAAEKITDPLHEIMDKAAQDQQIPVRVWLRGMTGEEILPLVPVSHPTFASTAAEIQAYLDASTQAWQSLTDDLYLYGQFTDNHRGEFGEVLFQSKNIPVMAGTATAAKIKALAGLQMVRKIDPAVGFDEALPDPELPEDPAALKKLGSKLREFMTIATHDEMIPVSIDLKDPPAEEIDALIPSGSENDRLARNEASRQVYSALNAGFVEDHLDEGDEIIFVSSYLSNIRATVPKHKIAGLAALDDVTNIEWIPYHDDPVYSDSTQVVPVPPRDSQPPVDPAAYDKLAPYLIEKLEDAPNSAKIPIDITLATPSEEEILAQLDIPVPGAGATLEEVNAYNSAVRRAKREVYSAITSAFVENYLDENDTVRVRGNYIPTLIVEVPKPKVFSLAALEEVTSIGWAGGYTTVYPTGPGSSVPSEEPDYVQKIDPYLLGYMQNAANDEPVRVEFELSALSKAEIEAQTGLTAPDLSSTMAEIRAWNRAVEAIYAPLFDAFYRKLDVDEEVEGDFIRNLTPVVWTVLPKGKALSLAALDEVQALNYYDESTEGLPPPLRDKPNLQYLIEEAEDYLEAHSAAEFMPDAYSAFIETLDAARALIADEKASAYDVDQACSQLPSALSALKRAKVDISAKLSSALVEYMEGKADDAMIPIAVYLVHPSSEEIEAMVPIPQPDIYSTVTMEEVNAYITAKRAVGKEVFSGITGAFVQNYLDEKDKLRYRGLYTSTVICDVPKSKVLSLAALEDVTSIGYAPNGPAYSMWIRDESEAAKKLTEPLKAHMENLSDEEPVTISVDLHMPSEEIMERLVSVPKPAEDASQEEIDAYNEAYRQTWKEQVALRTDAFVNHTLSGSEPVPVYYIGQDDATVICEVPVYRVRNLAFGQEITQIDLAGDPGETDKSALAEAIVAAQALDLDKYTEESAAGLREQMEIAGSILAKLDATQEEIDAAAQALNAAIQQLESIANSKLDAYLIEQMEAAADDKMFKVIVLLKCPTAAEIKAMIPVPYPGDDATREELQEYNSAKRKVEQEVFSAITADFVENHLDESNPIEDRGIFEPQVIFWATKAQIYALAELDEVRRIDTEYTPPSPTDKTALAEAIAEAKAIDLSLFTEESAAPFRDGIAAAEAVLAKADATQEEIEAAARALKDLIQSLTVSQPITRDLAGLIAEAETIDLSLYTEESAAQFEEEFEKARFILAKTDATQAEIDAACKALEDAIAGLVHYSSDEPPEYHAADSTEKILDWIRTERAKPREEWEDSWYHFLNDASKADKLLTAQPATEDCTLKEVMAISSSFGLDYFFLKDTDRIELAITPLNVTSDMTSEEALDDYMAQANRELSAQYEDWQFAKSTAKIGNTDIAFYFCDGGDYAQKDSDKKTLVGPTAFFAWQGHLVMIRGIDKLYGTKWDNDFFDLFRYELSDLSQPQFEDVRDPNAYYYGAVYWAFEHQPQITNGMDATHFRPELSCTRAQVMTFLWRAAGCPEPESLETSFTDLRPNAFYTKSVAWAVEQGITKGTSPTTFSPDQPCARGMIVTFLWRAFGSPEPETTQNPFLDVPAASYCSKAVQWCYENNITTGVAENRFGTGEETPRGQVVTFLYRATAE